ncbi:MAG: DUF4847 family protein [Bacteroidaceae bacterium]|nr:DUF4847 family protein [Bacteroidaceae bacterium]
MRLKNLLSILLLLPLMCCCQEDDIDVIFVKSGTWNVGNFCVGGKWDKTNDGAKVIYQKNEDLKALNQMTVIFDEDGTLSGSLLNGGTFTAKWGANGKDRTIWISNMKTSVTPSGKSKELIDALTNAAFYKGDSNVLKIAPEDKKSYVQFGHYSK